MKICFLGDGNSIHIQRWLDYFKNKGHEVHLISFSHVSLDGIFVHKVGDVDINENGGNWRYLLQIKKIKSLLKEINADIVNAHYITSYGLIGALTGAKNLILSAWGSDILVTPKKNIVYKALTKFALNRSKLITSDSDIMTEEIIKMTKVKTITVPMGVEENLLHLKRKEEEDIKILSLRTVNKNSNIDLIVKAFHKLSEIENDKNIKLIITNSGSEMGNIKKMIKDMKLQNRVEIKGFVSREEILELLTTSQIFISVLTSDSTSVTLLEAMATGVFPIVSNIPANRQWIENGKNGLVIESFKEEDLFNALRAAIKNSSLSEEAVQVNKKIIKERALWENNMRLVEKEMEEIV
ncbi:mannosylfructose-phosphate synthase [Clostridium homopropionicum DSM 5847]|uniref:Mannosylfructose-phosphate synthase n=1 Tax=Clostridium homopropionicum DSM 5847 TaxID=1121318 RepID=A0A0L6ZE89_9CLOT|nr:glycosyltransferase family 4 protein [Clostridium homopropionicum]KOA21118.1 mannosylfructose-phosphate synthase [Clostridium homopropionicum DSM 5847]SFF96824.1 Glycosyltransferase involved in cell wall bisynthesis [Clostridium homopropionicum]